jgi:RNA polymerase sigma factor (sigma-70 family)
VSGSRTTCAVARSERTISLARQNDVNALVHRAAAGEQRAWTLLVGRFDATVRGLARRYGLSDADRDEVAQRTWLALYRHIDRLKEHPAVAGWLITTAKNECLRVIAARKREVPVEEPIGGREPDEASVEDELFAAERREALRRAVESAPEHERRLVEMLLHEPPLSYDEISAALRIPKGSIGPTRGRFVARLRGDRHLASVVHGRPVPGHDLA